MTSARRASAANASAARNRLFIEPGMRISTCSTVSPAANFSRNQLDGNTRARDHRLTIITAGIGNHHLSVIAAHVPLVTSVPRRAAKSSPSPPQAPGFGDSYATRPFRPATVRGTVPDEHQADPRIKADPGSASPGRIDKEMRTNSPDRRADGPWYVAYCAEVPGANGQGKTREECLANLRQAIA